LACKNRCKHAGELTRSCQCKCTGPWSGPECQTCALTCANGGMLDSTSCKCRCRPGYFGEACDEYLLFQWKGMYKHTMWAAATISWKINDFFPGARLERVADSNGPVFPAQTKAMSTSQGKIDIWTHTQTFAPGYPRAWFYRAKLPNGPSCSVSPCGFRELKLSTAFFDGVQRCLKGGNKPQADAKNICAGAFCDEALTGDGRYYKGCQHKTRSGRECQRWNSQSPHKHTRTKVNYPSRGLGNHNFCRNPDGEPTIWCYTTDPSKRWEFSDVKD